MTRTAIENAFLAARAVAKVKDSARGWSMLSREEIVALAFIADLILTPADLPAAPQAEPAPPVISEI